MKSKIFRINTFTVIMSIVLFGLLFAGCTQENPNENPDQADPLAQAQTKARVFLQNAPTYLFDGSDLTLIDSMVQESYPEQYVFTFTFTSANGGYGNRTGQAVLTALTPHVAQIVVSDGKIVSAVLDNTWDEKNQRMINTPMPPESEQRLCLPSDREVSGCTKEYMPVCGWFDQSIQCFAYPCAQTYSNHCVACENPDVTYTTPGDCPAPGINPNPNTNNSFDIYQFARQNYDSCDEPRVCGDLAYINCGAEVDGPAYYYNTTSGDLVSHCGGYCMGINDENREECQTLCPPPQWNCGFA